ncbi:MAG: thioredoxin [Firmicutes bacterium]|jgi:thioredoxin 1|nr:thioredoxin [Bacillota bacterium]
MADVKEINAGQFDAEVINSSLPVLVDFWAPWCGPCRMLAPVLEEVAREKGDSLKVVKVNVDENPDLASQYEVMSIPTMVFFKNGTVVDSFTGAMSKQELSSRLDALL